MLKAHIVTQRPSGSQLLANDLQTSTSIPQGALLLPLLRLEPHVVVLPRWLQRGFACTSTQRPTPSTRTFAEKAEKTAIKSLLLSLHVLVAMGTAKRPALEDQGEEEPTSKRRALHEVRSATPYLQLHAIRVHIPKWVLRSHQLRGPASVRA